MKGEDVAAVSQVLNGKGVTETMGMCAWDGGGFAQAQNQGPNRAGRETKKSLRGVARKIVYCDKQTRNNLFPICFYLLTNYNNVL